MGDQKPAWPARRSRRLVGYDYAQAGLYFVTICTWRREALLGEVVDGEVRLSAAGVVVGQVWEGLGERFPGVGVDAFVVMPNHVHGIVMLGTDPEIPAGGGSASLAAVVRTFKSVSGIEGNRVLGRSGQPFWQRGYFDRIIRHERELEEIRRYIYDNPMKWEMDSENVSGSVFDHGVG